jgi:CheY-like chemotaxis protein
VEPVAGSDQARPLVLVVEDNPVNQLVALGILETIGYAAHTAGDGEEAIDAWRRTPYDAILMDVQMPRMDGYAATRAIRAAEKDGERIPIVAMTAAAVEGEREKCLQAGMDDFLTKPVDPGALGETLRVWLLDGGPTDGQAPAVESAQLPPEEPAGDVLDLGRLDMLRDLDPGNTSYLDRAIGNFDAASEESLEAIRAAVAAEDPTTLTYTAHRLKGSAQNLGLPRVGALAYDLELIGDSGTTQGAAARLAGLADALDEAVVAVRAYQRSYTAG